MLPLFARLVVSFDTFCYLEGLVRLRSQMVECGAVGEIGRASCRERV